MYQENTQEISGDTKGIPHPFTRGNSKGILWGSEEILGVYQETTKLTEYQGNNRGILEKSGQY